MAPQVSSLPNTRHAPYVSVIPRGREGRGDAGAELRLWPLSPPIHPTKTLAAQELFCHWGQISISSSSVPLTCANGAKHPPNPAP